MFNLCNKLAFVYYEGTSEDWASIEINSFANNKFTKAARYYYSETYQEGCWHYDTDGKTPVLW